MSKTVLTKNTVAVFPRGPKIENTPMTASTIRPRRKGGPQHYVEGKNRMSKGICTSTIMFIISPIDTDKGGEVYGV